MRALFIQTVVLVVLGPGGVGQQALVWGRCFQW